VKQAWPNDSRILSGEQRNSPALIRLSILFNDLVLSQAGQLAVMGGDIQLELLLLRD